MYVSLDAVGPKVILIRTNVNFFKCLTSLWILSLMWFFNNWSKGMWVYLFIHGSYGIAWLIKDRLFPDSQTLRKASLGSHLVLTIVLLCYWMIPVSLAMGLGINNPSVLRISSIIGLYVVGLVLMMGSDYQKYKTLKIRKGKLTQMKVWYQLASSSTHEIPIIWGNCWYIFPSVFAVAISWVSWPSLYQHCLCLLSTSIWSKRCPIRLNRAMSNTEREAIYLWWGCLKIIYLICYFTWLWSSWLCVSSVYSQFLLSGIHLTIDSKYYD